MRYNRFVYHVFTLNVPLTRSRLKVLIYIFVYVCRSDAIYLSKKKKKKTWRDAICDEHRVRFAKCSLSVLITVIRHLQIRSPWILNYVSSRPYAFIDVPTSGLNPAQSHPRLRNLYFSRDASPIRASSAKGEAAANSPWPIQVAL